MSEWVRNSRRQVGERRKPKNSIATEIRNALFGTVDDLKLGRKHRPDYFMVILIFVLSLIGLITLFSITPALTSGDDSSTTQFMVKQVAFLLIGITAFVIISKIPLDFWRKYGNKIFLVALIICFILPIMGWLSIPPAYCTLGACRWFKLGSLGTFQPAELLKFGIVLFTAGFLAVKVAVNEVNSFRKTFLPLGLVVLSALFVIVFMQKDLGTGVSLLAIVLVQMVVAGVSGKVFLAVIASVAGLGVLAIATAPHRLARIATFFGQGDATTDYHINQAMIALGSGGLTGRGLGQSVQAYGWLPEAIHDSIFAVIGESLGYIGTFVVIICFAILLQRIVRQIDYLENTYLRLIIAGVFGWIAAHVILNIGAMTHMIPLTGITLPLVSLGGTSMLFIMSSLGLVFSISRYTLHRKINQEGDSGNENPLSRRRVGRSRHASSSSR